MPFSKSAQSKGGKAPASDRQKEAARATIARTQPWKKSTGPKTRLGKVVSSQNPIKSARRWKLRSSDPDFEFKRQAIFQAIGWLDEIAARHHLIVNCGCFQVGSFQVSVRTLLRNVRCGVDEWHVIALSVSSQIQTVHSTGESIKQQEQQLQAARDAAWVEIREVLKLLRLIKSSPTGATIEVAASPIPTLDS